MDPLRYRGKLKKWNTERGFGFIVADDGGQDVFVHISEFPRDGLLPTEGELLNFEVQPDRSGKRSAVRVRRHASVAAKAPNERSGTIPNRPSSRKKSGPLTTLVLILVVVAMGMYAFRHYRNSILTFQADSITPNSVSAPSSTQEAPVSFKCDGRKYCSQMTSCSEAKLFLKNCQGMEMDGNNDGIPCEQQWCK